MMEQKQLLTVMMSEALQYALETGHVTREAVEACEPHLMFAIPRLAIVRYSFFPSTRLYSLFFPSYFSSSSSSSNFSSSSFLVLQILVYNSSVEVTTRGNLKVN